MVQKLYVHILCLSLFTYSILGQNSQSSTPEIPISSPDQSTQSPSSTTNLDQSSGAPSNATIQLSSSTSSETTSTATPQPSSTTTDAPTTPHPIIETSYTWTESDIQDNNPIVFQQDEGYFVSVTVSDVKLADGHYILIQGGEVPNEKDTNGRVFANTVKGPISYLFETSSVYALYGSIDESNTEDDNTDEFTVIFERTGEPTTTVSTTTTTTISVPTTEKGASMYITVNVTGRFLAEYTQETVEAFKTCLVIMATNYCKEQNINLLQDITNPYVMISSINQCPYNWPGSEKCVEITFKLPIFYNSSDWNGYQLNTKHLEIMWLRWAELDDQCLTKNSFEVYIEPNVERNIVWWAVGISLVIICFVVLLWFLRTSGSKIRTALKKRNRRNSDTMSIISRKTDSVSSLTPHYLQDHLDTPKFFET